MDCSICPRNFHYNSNLLFLYLKKKIRAQNAGAIAASYGSIRCKLTFIYCCKFSGIAKNNLWRTYGRYYGHRLEAPAIMVGVLLLNIYKEEKSEKLLDKSIVSHAFTNGSVLLILASLLIGWIASDSQSKRDRTFLPLIFSKGFLAIFLLDMGYFKWEKIR